MRINEEIDALESMAIRPIEYLVSTRLVAGMIAITPLYSIAVILSFLASKFVTVVLFGQSAGLYTHYFDTFLNPLDLLWSFLQAVLMAITILLIHTYYGYFASGGPSGVGVAVGNAVRTSLIVVVAVTLLVSLAIYGSNGNFNLAGRRWPNRDSSIGRTHGRWPLLTVLALALIVMLAVGLFRDSFRDTMPVTVVADRAGLVMNPDAKVKLHGAQMGKVASIEPLAGGGAALHLAIDPESVDAIPANVGAEITSSTVFGAKFVELVAPAAVGRPVAGRDGDQGQRPRHRRTQHRLRTARLGAVQGGTGQAQPDSRRAVEVAQAAGEVRQDPGGAGQCVEQDQPELGQPQSRTWPWPRRCSTRSPTRHLICSPRWTTPPGSAPPSSMSRTAWTHCWSVESVWPTSEPTCCRPTAARWPTSFICWCPPPIRPTSTTRHSPVESPVCSAGGRAGPRPAGSRSALQGFFLGRERYRYPGNLPKVAAKGGPQCTDLPNVGYEQRPPFVVTDIGANQAQYGNQGILLNSDGLKQALFDHWTGRRATPRRSASRMTGPT